MVLTYWLLVTIEDVWLVRCLTFLVPNNSVGLVQILGTGSFLAKVVKVVGNARALSMFWDRLGSDSSLRSFVRLGLLSRKWELQ